MNDTAPVAAQFRCKRDAVPVLELVLTSRERPQLYITRPNEGELATLRRARRDRDEARTAGNTRDAEFLSALVTRLSHGGLAATWRDLADVTEPEIECWCFRCRKVFRVPRLELVRYATTWKDDAPTIVVRLRPVT